MPGRRQVTNGRAVGGRAEDATVANDERVHRSRPLRLLVELVAVEDNGALYGVVTFPAPAKPVREACRSLFQITGVDGKSDGRPVETPSREGGVCMRGESDSETGLPMRQTSRALPVSNSDRRAGNSKLALALGEEVALTVGLPDSRGNPRSRGARLLAAPRVPEFEIGVGMRPANFRVLYGESDSSSLW